MSAGLSPENESFIEQVVAAGVFPDRVHALDEAVALLKRRQEILAKIDRGTEQLANGDYVEFDDNGLRKFFDDLQARGRARYEQSVKRQ
jgi:Arc/MetJ-type ribon-helix-helix transcriptional regulator